MLMMDMDLGHELDQWVNSLETVPVSGGQKEILSKWLSFLEASKTVANGPLNILKAVQALAAKFKSSTESPIEPKEQFLAQVLTAVCSNDEFLGHLKTTVVKWSRKLDKVDDLAELLQSSYLFCRETLERVPFLGKDVLGSFICVSIGVVAANPTLLRSFPVLLEQLTGLQKQIQEIDKIFQLQKRDDKKRAEQDDFLHLLEPPENFRDLPILPTLDEMVNEKHPFLRPNLVKGSYRSSEHYLDVQFRLLREDLVQPLRRGVQEFLKNKDEFIRTRGRKKPNSKERDSSVKIYTDLSFIRSETSNQRENSTDFLFNLPSRLVKNVNWDKSKRLISGSLVMLTADYCKTAIFGVTLQPPFQDPRQHKKTLPEGADQRSRELAEGVLRLSIELGEELIVQDTPYLMFECEAYFESYRFNLEVLQRLTFLDNDDEAQPNFLHKIIVQMATSEIGSPKYFLSRDQATPLKLMLDVAAANEELTISHLPTSPMQSPILSDSDDDDEFNEIFKEDRSGFYLNPFKANAWPQQRLQNLISLDPDQYEAWKTALTSEVAVIQGPPGTGKTYVGLQIVKTLLFNKRNEILPAAPILILCYTNHALDQFLELILKKLPSTRVVRCGGQSKSDLVKQHGLSQHRKRLNSQFEPFFKYDNMRSLNQNRVVMTALEKVQNLEILESRLKDEIAELNSPSGIFDWKCLETGARLFKVLPTILWNTMTNERWLEMHPENFLTEEFHVGENILTLFVVKPRAENAATTSVGGCKSKMTQQQYVEKDTADLEENEEHDMDELLEQRLDDYSPELRLWSSTLGLNRNERHSSIYLHKCSLKTCQESFMDLKKQLKESIDHREWLHWQRLNNTSYNEFELNDLGIRIINLRQQKLDYENRSNFLATVFGLYKERRLEMPDLEKLNLLRIDHLNLNHENAVEIRTGDVFRLPVRLKWALYFKVVDIAAQLAKEYLNETKMELQKVRKEYDGERSKLDGCILQDAHIIGMTTTGAAKYHALLEMAKPEIVVVEEAAEILEAHVVTSLTEDCKHLILIGDHQQLQPSTAVWQLATRFHMNVSLFERLIINNVPYCTLKTQHRMRPEISDLIIGPIYDDLRNHPKVYTYPVVRGVKKSIFFITHSEPEATDTDLVSKSNDYEASFLVALCEYILKQGYEPQTITILTTYMGQMFHLRKMLPGTCRGVRITCVDNFQGEENDIILLSLVRSNDNDEVGFVKKDNRICVALSRARNGLYVVGNMDSMAKSSKTWKKIQRKLQDNGNIGSQLELICKRHETVTEVRHKKDFRPLVNGGCGNPCKTLLNCGHICPRICHADDHDHLNYKCAERCLKKCQLDHQCEVRCSKDCPKCQIRVEKKLPCGHLETVSCYMDPAAVLCKVPVLKTLGCQHELELECNKDVNRVECQTLLEKILPCGHVRLVKCYIPENQVKCDVKEWKELACGHILQLQCYKSLAQVECQVMVKKTMKCGHHTISKCHRNVDQVECEKKVEKELGCGHKITLMCYQGTESVRCRIEIEVVQPNCGHVQLIPCSNKHDPCTKKCEKLLACGHTCSRKCHTDKDPDHHQYKCKKVCKRSCDAGHRCQFSHLCFRKCLPCGVLVDVVLKCGHKVTVSCDKNNGLVNCRKRMIKELPCGHNQKVLCYMDPSKHQCTKQIKDCQKKCSNGHSCPLEHSCYEGCPPCEQKIEKTFECGHTTLVVCHEGENCLTKVEKTLPCGHTGMVACGTIPLLTDCKKVEGIGKCSKCTDRTEILCGSPGTIICSKCASGTGTSNRNAAISTRLRAVVETRTRVNWTRGRGRGRGRFGGRNRRY